MMLARAVGFGALITTNLTPTCPSLGKTNSFSFPREPFKGRSRIRHGAALTLEKGEMEGDHILEICHISSLRTPYMMALRCFHLSVAKAWL